MFEDTYMGCYQESVRANRSEARVKGQYAQKKPSHPHVLMLTVTVPGKINTPAAAVEEVWLAFYQLPTQIT